LEAVKDELIIAPYNKVFISHDYQDIAVGMIVATSMDSKGLLILAKLNEDHKRANEVWSSLQSGFLDAFSIGGKFVTVETYWDEKKEEYYNVATKIEASEVSLTSIPANPESLLLGAFEKARKFVKAEIEKERLINDSGVIKLDKMVEDKKLEEGNSGEGDNNDAGKDNSDAEAKKAEAEKLEADNKAKTDEEAKAKEEADKKTEDDKKAEEDKAKEEADKKTEEDKKAEEEKKSKEEADKKTEEEKAKAKEDADKKAEEDKAKEEADKKDSEKLIDAKKVIEDLTKKNTDLISEIEKLKEENKELKKMKKSEGAEASDNSSEDDKEDKSDLDKTDEPMRKSYTITKDYTLDSNKPKSKTEQSEFMKWLNN
jgi:HK97 family phage prohead protease